MSSVLPHDLAPKEKIYTGLYLADSRFSVYYCNNSSKRMLIKDQGRSTSTSSYQQQQQQQPECVHRRRCTSSREMGGFIVRVVP